MKHPAGSVQPRRLRAPKTAPKKKVRLDLKRRAAPEPEDYLETRQKSQFWKWVGLVALLHLIVIGLAYFLYESSASVKPPEEFISLLPEGDVVKGTPGAQQAHKVGASTPAPAVHHVSPPPAHTAEAPKPIAPKPPAPTPPKPDAPSLVQEKPVPPPKPAPPKVKVKVDLSQLVDAPSAPDKPKHHTHKPVVKADDSTPDDQAETRPESTGLSKEQIAEKLGEKLDEAGVTNATHTGTSGSTNTRENPFSAFYASITQQIDETWEIPNVAAEISEAPLVHIHVEKDGRVPPESVYLITSSGNSVYDDSAVAAAKNLGYLHEPLPEGCPPDISIHFKPAR